MLLTGFIFDQSSFKKILHKLPPLSKKPLGITEADLFQARHSYCYSAKSVKH